jgi:hypothetical protein
LLHPNPLNPAKYVIVYACNDPATFAENGFFEMRGESVWKFRRGDAVISGIPAERSVWGVAVDRTRYRQRHVMFGADWRPDQRPPLGEATAAFDYLQLLRLRADALREVADVDVGIIWSHSSRWNRWSDSLPRGPVTFEDLATQDACPEQVCVGEMSGRDLLGQRSQPAAWSLLTDNRQEADVAPRPLAVSDIEPDKTYRVAMGYRGIPMYRTNPKEMPRLFRWGTEEEFLANENNSIPIRGLKRTPLQVAEAVAQYLRKHQQIAPRRTSFRLADYIANPEYNDFGACDWLHLGTEVSWPNEHAGGAQRYTISLGVRPYDAPAQAGPRPDSKCFVEFDLAEEDPALFDFARLDWELPLAVTTETRRWAIAVAADGESAVLEEPGAERAFGGATLLIMRLASRADRDLALKIVLNRSVMSRIHGEAWPDAATKDQDSYFAGYHRAVGQYRQPPDHEDGVLLLSAAGPATLNRLVAENAGYNFGLVGLEHETTIRADSTLVLPVLFVWVSRSEQLPEARLIDVLMDLKNDLIGRLTIDASGP